MAVQDASFPVPLAGRDQIFYQLLPDRFSDGREDTRPLFDHTHPDQFTKPDKAAWMAAGNRFLGARSPELTIAKPTKTP